MGNSWHKTISTALLNMNLNLAGQIQIFGLGCLLIRGEISIFNG